MKHAWVIEPADVEKLKAFVALHKDSLFVKQRIDRNLRDDTPPVRKEDIWQQMVACLLTTQQRSGPTSAVTRFIRTAPFPLAYEVCRKTAELAPCVLDAAIFSSFDGGGWTEENIVW
jgi:hypothetical protein